MVWKKTTVSLTTLDQLIETYGVPRFCKIDTEGFEAEVLSGLSTAIPALSFEHSAHSPKCIDMLSRLGECRFNYSAGETMTLASPQWASAAEALSLVKEAVAKTRTYGDIYCVQEHKPVET